MRTSDGEAYWSDTKGGGWRPSSIHSIAALEKLAAYEDTGIDPEEIEYRQDVCLWIPEDRFAEIINAEADGRLVVLPCKVGDTVYVEWSDGLEYDKSVVEKISIGADGQARFLIPAYLHSHSASWYQTSDFGKTVFLTREEAEATLKGE